MKTADLNTTLIDSYFTLLKSLSPNNKLELIAKLSKSLKTSKKAKIIILFFLNSCALSSSYDYIYYKSLQGDSTNIIKFIKIDNIYDANGYDHGERILEIIETIGDSTFSLYINNLKSEKQLKNLKN